jgi:hypothetical protein
LAGNRKYHQPPLPDPERSSEPNLPLVGLAEDEGAWEEVGGVTGALLEDFEVEGTAEEEGLTYELEVFEVGAGAGATLEALEVVVTGTTEALVEVTGAAVTEALVEEDEAGAAADELGLAEVVG